MEVIFFFEIAEIFPEAFIGIEEARGGGKACSGSGNDAVCFIKGSRSCRCWLR